MYGCTCQNMSIACFWHLSRGCNCNRNRARSYQGCPSGTNPNQVSFRYMDMKWYLEAREIIELNSVTVNNLPAPFCSKLLSPQLFQTLLGCLKIQLTGFRSHTGKAISCWDAEIYDGVQILKQCLKLWERYSYQHKNASYTNIYIYK